jgi:thiol-disulfide isomerase/thioredoxin
MNKVKESQELDNPEKLEREPEPIKVPSLIYDEEPKFQYTQRLGLIIVVGLLLIGSAAGTYSTLQTLMEAPCLGCLGLYPNIELNFTFNTLEDRPHPDWVLESLKDGPVFIEFTQNDENCPPCKRMRPYIHDLNDEYNEEVVFYIININEHETAKSFQGKTDIKSSYSDEDAFYVYDIELIVGGVIATPTYIILTLNSDGESVRPFFSVGYGEFIEEDAKKTSETLAETLDYAKTMHHHYLEMYITE